MAETASTPQIGAVERALLAIDDGAFGALYRVAIGFATLPAMSLLLGSHVSDWLVVPFLLSILLLLRIIPAVVRKLVPFSGAVQEAWAARRRLAKQYDSYQWRKLMWIGIGLALYTAVSGQLSASRMVVGSACLLGGAAGMVRWRLVSADIEHAKVAREKTASTA